MLNTHAKDTQSFVALALLALMQRLDITPRDTALPPLARLAAQRRSAAVDALLAGGTALSSFPFPGSGEAEARTAPLGGALRRGTRQLPTRLF